jgi:hypothetical protein
MDFEIKPLQGAGILRFGMDVVEVRSLLGGQWKSFKKTPNASYPCDHFLDANVFAYYKESGILEALEFYDGASPLLNGTSLIGLKATDARNILEGFDKLLEFDSDSITSHSLGVGVYAPGWEDEEGGIVESVIIFEEGYY